MIRRLLYAIAALAFSSSLSLAQTTPNLIYGQVPTAAQWNSFFAAKQDLIGYIPLNVAGGIMTGELITAPSATNTAGFNLTPGVAPTSPNNGDMWVDSSGLWIRVAGTSIGPLGTLACPTCVVNNATNTFTAYQVMNLNATTVPTVATGSILQLTQADTTVGRVEVDTFGAAAVFTGFRSDGTNASPTTLLVNDEVSSLSAWGYDGTARSTSASAALRIYAGGTWSNTSHPTYIDFSTTAVSSTTLTSRMRVENDGGITVGGVSSQGVGTLNLPVSSLFNNGVGPTGSGGYVLSGSPSLTTPTLNNPTVVGTLNGSGVVPNSALVNSSITIGSTAMALGSTNSTVVGLTLTTPTINGAALSGTVSGTPTFSGANFVTLANIVQDATAYSLLGNTTSGSANYAPFTVGSLTNKSSPTGSDILLLQDAAAGGALKYCTISQCVGATAAGVTSINTQVGSLTATAGITNSGTQLQADGNYSGFGVSNCTIAATVSGNLLTVALKDNSGADPTTTSPCNINYRNASLSTGSTTLVSQTSALSVSTNSTSATLGTQSALVPFKLWVVSFNNGGVNVLALVNLVGAGGFTATTTLYPLDEGSLQTSVPFSASATSAGTLYTPNGTTVTSKAIRILGYVEYGSGLTTAGTFASGPTKIVNMTPSIKKPGEVIQQVQFLYSGSASLGIVGTFSPSALKGNFTLVSAANPLRMWTGGWAYLAASGNIIETQIFRGNNACTTNISLYVAIAYASTSTYQTVNMNPLIVNTFAGATTTTAGQLTVCVYSGIISGTNQYPYGSASLNVEEIQG